LAYLQNETELTRSTLVHILKESGRLGEIFNNPEDTLAVFEDFRIRRIDDEESDSGISRWRISSRRLFNSPIIRQHVTTGRC
jgi:arsenate reductase-like glutaredoxin family protein